MILGWGLSLIHHLEVPGYALGLGCGLIFYLGVARKWMGHRGSFAVFRARWRWRLRHRLVQGTVLLGAMILAGGLLYGRAYASKFQ